VSAGALLHTEDRPLLALVNAAEHQAGVILYHVSSTHGTTDMAEYTASLANTTSVSYAAGV
jgi:hypothetical protein